MRDQVPMGNVETVRTSSSRHEVGSGNRPNSIGCMSGIFHFLSRHHNRSRKRITSVKKKENTTAPPPTRSTPPPPEAAVEGTKKMRHSSETPRSPVIPQEIRRRKPVPESPESPRTPPALVARLMGLNDAPPPVAVAGDQRRELLRALEKCDEDLQALTRIIEAIRSAEIQEDAVVSTAGKTAERLLEIETSAGDTKSECNGEQPSPVSVLEAISSPRYRSRLRSQRPQEDSEGSPANESRIVKPSRMAVFHTEDVNHHNKKAHEATRRLNIMEPMPSGQATAEEFGGRWSWWRAGRRCASRAMAESVEEVWEEGAEKERWELGRVRSCLEAHLLGELVEELAVELLGLCCKLSSPACRKRLRF